MKAALCWGTQNGSRRYCEPRAPAPFTLSMHQHPWAVGGYLKHSQHGDSIVSNGHRGGGGHGG